MVTLVNFCFRKNVANLSRGNIEHVVATVTEGDKYLIFIKMATGSSVESDQKIVPIAELQNRGLVDDQMRAGPIT